MPAFFRISLLFLSASLWHPPAVAQASSGLSIQAPPQSTRTPSDSVRPEASQEEDVRISLLTILPGSDVYSLWGHSAVRVRDAEADLSYNYGTFNFATNFFVLRFLHGSLDYMLDVHDVDAALQHYRAEGRPVIEQVLDLSPAQKEKLIHFLQINARPENRSYRYHFLFDNCSTRIRDALEQALDGDVRFVAEPDPHSTFRALIDPYQRAVPFLDAGIDWLLGAPVDRVALPYETMFLPHLLMEAFDHAAVEIDGISRPLVAQKDTLIWIDGYDPPGRTFPWEAGVTWLLFAAGLVATIRTRGSRGFVRIVDVPVFLVVGLAGLLITYLWFVSHHDVTGQNWHLLWAWPTHLIAAVALLNRRSDYPPWLTGYAAASALLALAAIVGTPVWPQPLHPVLLPIMLLLALRGGAVFAASRRRPEPSSPSPA